MDTSERRNRRDVGNPANIALVGPPREFEGYPSVREYLHAVAAQMRLAQLRSKTGFVAWIGFMDLLESIDRQLDNLARHPDRPIGPKAHGQLRRVAAAIRADLVKSKPF